MIGSVNYYRSYNFLSILVAALCMLWTAIYNGYPLVYSDTGAYIFSGFEGVVPMDRPIAYGLFIRHSSLAASLWFTIIAQALLTSALLFFIVTKFIAEPKPRAVFFVGSVFILSFFSSLSWVVAMLLADVFTAISILLLAIILLFTPAKKWLLVLLVPVYWFATATHLTHAPTHVFVLLVLGLFKLVLPSVFSAINWRKWCLGFAMVLANFLVLPLLHFNYQAGFVNARAGHVFLSARMVESGAMKTYLDDACATHPYNLCAYKDSLPKMAPDFIWQAKSPFQKLGAWEGNADEYKKINQEILCTPKYLWVYLKFYWQVVSTQITAHKVGEEVLPFGAESPPGWEIKTHFVEEQSAFLNAKQAKDTWPNFFHVLNISLSYIFAFSVLASLYFLWVDREKSSMFLLLLVVFLAYFGNLLVVCIASSGCRYNTRLDWLLLFVVLLTFTKKAIDNKKSIFKNQHSQSSN